MTTLKQVALRAGCSMATASRVLNLSGPVSQAAALRVRRAAAEVGYRAAVPSTRSGRRPVIGVLVPSVTNPVFASSLSGIQNRMLVAGHSVLIAQSNYDPDQEADAVAGLLSERPTGLILTVCDALTSPVLAQELPPTVLLGNPPSPRFPAAVTVNNYAAGCHLTEYLLSMGHRRILYVSGSFKASDRALLRYRGYLQTMEAAGVAPLEAVEVSFVSGYDQMDLGEALRAFAPTAIIGSNDLIALGVIGAIHREGLRVPDDVSVAGFDGIAIGKLINPTLTSIEMPDLSMGATAASLLLDIVENDAPLRHLELSHALHAGGTVRNLGKDETAAPEGCGGSGSTPRAA
ncbi:DNA-binding LacI/PurR family transcriptional regulator [Rhizobium sp. BK529]|uniref:substrate-binding domain-containing protein n=1 Tax=unclassified Rhizobium TaxID=2613769 RepID=UPI001046FAD5|nr:MULTISPECIES: substrate-binding domain-containing protein [unclassified Rhizobium]MBB3593910.1 DNA-binding LacI/PurR family transcriptional regulator [Rhizobium sp. BK529]TCS01367.1 LacI family transcriptional regulator [Rhizobium sp. BK418]